MVDAVREFRTALCETIHCYAFPRNAVWTFNAESRKSFYETRGRTRYSNSHRVIAARVLARAFTARVNAPPARVPLPISDAALLVTFCNDLCSGVPVPSSRYLIFIPRRGAEIFIPR